MSKTEAENYQTRGLFNDWIFMHLYIPTYTVPLRTMQTKILFMTRLQREGVNTCTCFS